MQYLDIGQYIRDKRELADITLNEFAFDCGIEPATLSNFERGKSDILFQNLVKIANGFNMSLPDLLLEYEKSKKI